MAQAASTFDEPVERKPGDFRRSKTGTPYVVDPTGATTQKGMPKLAAYGRPSGFGKLIESTYNLSKWSERTVALGVGVDYLAACEVMAAPQLVALCAQLVGRDRDTQEWRSDADAIVSEAKRLAKGGLAAERGTHAHALTEEDDQERDWIVLAERGEVLGLDGDVQRALVEAWREMLERDGLEVLATEMAVVHDEWRMAGTLDRIARLTKPLRFTLITGEIVELDAGTVVVLDIKSGKRRLDNKGVVMYWQTYAVQIATYAGGCVYDVDTDTRSPYPWPVDQRYALIAHLDVLGAIAGAATCTLVLVDIEAGREVGARLCIDAKAWGKRTDLFSIAQLDAEPAPCQTCLVDHEGPCVDIDAPIEAAESDDREASGGDQGHGVPPCSAASSLSEASENALDEPQPAPAVPPAAGVAATTPQQLHARLRRHPDIDEGATDDLDPVFTRMAKHFLALPNNVKDWAANLQNSAKQHGCGFHAKDVHSLRRFELIRGLITLGVAELDDDELIRYIVASITSDDAALFPIIEPGHALGALDATEAATFAALCDQLAVGQVVLTFTDAGHPQFVTRRAA